MYASLPIRIDKQDGIAKFIQTSLVKLGSIEHNRPNVEVGVVRREQYLTPSSETRIEQAFQPSKLRGITEYNLSDCLPVNLAAGATDGITPPTLQRRDHFRVAVLLMGQSIGVEHRRAERFEDSGDDRLARANSTGKTDDRLVSCRVDPRQFSGAPSR